MEKRLFWRVHFINSYFLPRLFLLPLSGSWL